MEVTTNPNEWDILKMFIEKVIPLELEWNKAYSEENRRDLNNIEVEIEKCLYRMHKLSLQNDSLNRKWNDLLSIGYVLLDVIERLDQGKCKCCSKLVTEIP